MNAFCSFLCRESEADGLATRRRTTQGNGALQVRPGAWVRVAEAQRDDEAKGDRQLQEARAEQQLGVAEERHVGGLAGKEMELG